MDKKNWSTVWYDNYSNNSDISKFVMSKSKVTYKGDAYLPWALLLGALYRQDENAEVVKCSNDVGGYVFTDHLNLRTIVNDVETLSTVVSHMVKVRVKFMDIWFEDVYPIQDKDYGASKVFDQNGVNKALQRCMARVISIATGIGWTLYEQTESQFDTEGATLAKVATLVVVNDLVKDTPKAKPVHDIVDPVDDTPTTPIDDLFILIDSNRTNQKVMDLMNNFNIILRKEFTDTDGTPLAIDLLVDDKDVLIRKLGRLKSPEKMLKGVKKTLGVA